MSLIHLFKKMNYWNRDIIGYRVIEVGCTIEKDLELSPSPPNCSKYSWKLVIHYLAIFDALIQKGFWVIQEITIITYTAIS